MVLTVTQQLWYLVISAYEWDAWASLLKTVLEHLMEKYCPFSDPHLLIISQYPAENNAETAGRCL